MLNAYYRIYLKQIFDLAKTMVIKSELVAETINRDLRLYGHPVSDNPYAWKYYMNLAGLYHDTDQVMTVTSMDTLETIEFTKENLEIHRATAEAYTYGSRYYRDLTERHPNQETLILGILNPIDQQSAIEASDGQILYVNRALIESQEVNFVPKLQEWIDAFMLRWNIAGYAITDEYYPAAQLGIMYTQMIPEIINLRQEACLTNEAHSFHIRERLASHNRLDVHLPYLTLKQSMFLYRNIKYLQRHAGTQETFNSLLERIINERNLPLAKYEVLHKTQDLAEDLRPEIEMRRIPLNDHPGDGSSNRRSVVDVSQRQFEKARNNQREHFNDLPNDVEKMENSLINRLPTKILESALLDTTDSVTFTREDTIFNHWIYLASRNRLTAVINVTNPSTGVSSPMGVKDAFVVFLWAFNKARGVTLSQIPPIAARRVRKSIVPSVDALERYCNLKRVPRADIARLRSGQPPMGQYISVGAFREFCNQLFVVQNRQRNQYSSYQDKYARAMAESVVAAQYQDVECDFGIGQYFTDWFAMRGLDYAELGPLDLDLLAGEILGLILGEDVSSTSFLADLQKNMLELMGRLSSYTVQYLQSINNTSYRVLDTVMPRVSDVDSRYLESRWVDIHRISAISTDLQSHTLQRAYRQNVGALSVSNSKGEGKADIDVGVTISVTNNPRHDARVPIGGVRMTVLSESVNEA